ncbi:MAG: DUF5615 family PIN-like protein [Patescibacteria group bacterium]
MKFLIDQDVYQLTIEVIKDLGHAVIPVKDVGLSTAADETILTYAFSHKLILVTRDNDYGALVFLMHKKHHGVIFLKIEPQYIDIVHDELKRVLRKYSKEKFANSFIVIEIARHRIRMAKYS